MPISRAIQEGSPGSLTGTAVVATHFGGAEALDVMKWPVRPPGPQEVRVRVEATAISFADLLMCQGLHPERRKPPFVPGWDVVGEVESVGAHVTDISSGDRVAGLSIVGGWAEHALIPRLRVVQVPAELDATSAVCLVMDYIVAYQMLTRSAPVRRGNTVLIQGAGGGVGTAAMQLGKTLDVRVLGTDREKKRAHIESEGGVLIDFEHEDVVERCRELTGGRGVDAAYDGIGATAWQSLKAVRHGGRLIWFGMVTMLSGSGRRDFRRGVTTALRVGPVLAHNLLPMGKRTSFYSIQQLAKKRPEWYQEDLTALLEMVAAGEISPRIAKVWALDEVPTAIAGMAKGAMPGKQVIGV